MVLWWFNFVTFLRDRPSLSLPLCCFCEWTTPVPAIFLPSCSGQKTVSSSSLSWVFRLALLLFFSVFRCHVLCISVSAHASVCDRLFTFTPFWSVREWAYLCVCANARTGVCVSVSSLPKTKLSRRGLQFCPVTLSTTLMQKKLLKSRVQLSKPSSYTL